MSGYLSRVPFIALDYFRRSPALMFLGNEKVPPGDLASDLDAKLRTLNVHLILVHPELMDADRFAAVTALLRDRRDLSPVPTGTSTLAYDVAPRP